MDGWMLQRGLKYDENSYPDFIILEQGIPMYI
jgi:hypothetical protein